jgi:2-oxo-4-hydroxy-4-carboxy-5-ureidoimidazoline decarboxylase
MTIEELNQFDTAQRAAALTKCCGASAWVKQMNDLFPVENEDVLLSEAERKWIQCSKQDWLEAFTHHPEIGDIDSVKEKYAPTRAWAEGEQSAVKQTSSTVLKALAAGNRSYQNKFGYIFIVCATGKTASEMLDLLLARLKNTIAEEIYIAMREQGKITALRLKKLLAS